MKGQSIVGVDTGMSRLVDRLEHLGHGGQTIGFRATNDGGTRLPILLVASSAADIELTPEGGAQDVDGLVLHAPAAPTANVLSRLAAAAGAVPWGLWLDQAGGLPESGIDFVVFDASAPAALLQREGLGRILRLSGVVPDLLLAGLGDLAFDAIYADIAGQSGYPTVQHVIYMRWLAKATGLPLLADAPAESEGVRALWEAGVSGLLLPVESGKGRLDALREIIKALPAHTASPRRRGAPLLPPQGRETRSK